MSVTPYADVDDLLERYDSRTVGDLAKDDGTQETEENLPQNTKVLAALADAYSQIISTIVVGNRYTLDQLEADNLSDVGLAYLVRLNCDMALLLMKQRRCEFNKEKDGAFAESIEARLKGLQSGAAALLGILDANAPAATIELDSPLHIPLVQRQTIRYKTQNYYPNHPYPNYPDSRGNQ